MPETALRIREIADADVDEFIRIDGLRTGLPKRSYWARVVAEFRRPEEGRVRVGLAAEAPAAGGLSGYLLGEVRAFEFGSEPCGWIFAVAVDPAAGRTGVATALLEEACRRFREAGVQRVRTMVRRNDVPFLSFFRARGFVGGPFVQLERDQEATS